MKRRELIGRIGESARIAGLTWALVRQGSAHEVWRLGDRQIAIPRHREINELTAQAIVRALEAELGEGWWRA
ncbi:MAG: hypothetical protein A2Z32_03210 [Chloroflexi bacterium RBG_16_69_14]|nr:MAG: hypothetical protein A2Z32_03210 [Chloroflexi bacterium RBG_16_69_14]